MKKVGDEFRAVMKVGEFRPFPVVARLTVEKVTRAGIHLCAVDTAAIRQDTGAPHRLGTRRVTMKPDDTGLLREREGRKWVYRGFVEVLNG